MSNIIHTIGGDTLSKAADYLSLQEVLNLAQTSKVMHTHVCSLPWFCDCCKGPALINGKPRKCEICGKLFCGTCSSIVCEETEGCKFMQTCDNCNATYCGSLSCTEFLRCDDCEQWYCEDCADDIMITCDTCYESFFSCCRELDVCDGCETATCENCEPHCQQLGNERLFEMLAMFARVNLVVDGQVK